jgi:hypothetical protein
MITGTISVSGKFVSVTLQLIVDRLRREAAAAAPLPVPCCWYRDVYGVDYALLTIRSGLRTPIAEIPTPDFAVPYAAPKQVNTMADVQPMAPKKGCRNWSVKSPAFIRDLDPGLSKTSAITCR